MNIDLTKTQQYLEWLKEKLYLNSVTHIAQKRVIYRGQVYWCKFGVGIGSEMYKERPCVILQYNSANKSSPNTIVAPITHTFSNLPVVVPLTPKIDSKGNVILNGNVLLGNIVCVSKTRLGDYITVLSSDEMKAIDKAISISLDVHHHYQALQNSYNDKLQYIEKLKSSLNSLRTELKDKQLLLDAYQKRIYELEKINS